MSKLLIANKKMGLCINKEKVNLWLLPEETKVNPIYK